MSISGHIKPAHNYVPEYQQSGIPWVKTINLPAIDGDNNINVEGELEPFNTDDNIELFKIEFSRLTRWFVIQNHTSNGGDIKLYFNKTAAKKAVFGAVADVDDHYYLLDAGHLSKRLELKCKYIYMIPIDKNKSVRVSVNAGLTNVRPDDFPDQTSDNGFTGVEN